MNQMKLLCELEATRVRCKEHPNDKQLPGVCSSCLRDKLSQLYTKNSNDCSLYYSSPLSPGSPQPIEDDSTNHGSLGHRNRRFHRNASHAAGSVSCMISFNNALNLKKSKSLAVATRSRVRERDVGGGRGRKKDGFWSKVLKLRRKETEESVVKSRT
ncbi:uncharacterized protein LOC131661465 [Vicia villosa]|uniref:uncharacterized protein LOC131661465 n=1 Tax=Vicia villosa TaxID=3911 RepID=UPI00273CA8F6|nr:uncharacterized protein LOC131661465 [Vicia villosa]